jgi:hypothetical protein
MEVYRKISPYSMEITIKVTKIHPHGPDKGSANDLSMGSGPHIHIKE